MAAELGDRVALNAVVRTISQDENGVRVEFEGGEVAGSHVIVTLPPTLAGRVRYLPPLPAARDGLTQQIPAGHVIKVQVAYETPFWREAGLNGFALSLDRRVQRRPRQLPAATGPAASSSGSSRAPTPARRAS